MAKQEDRMNKLVKCSFCGKTQDQVRRIVAGPGVYICDECILLCQEIVADDLAPAPSVSGGNLLRPKEIKKYWISM